MAGANLSPGLPGFNWAPAPLVLGGQSIPGSLGFDLPLARSQTDQAAQAYAFTGNAIGNILGFFSGITGAALVSTDQSQSSAEANQRAVLNTAQAGPSNITNLAGASVNSAGNFAYTSLGSFDALMARLFG